MKPQPFFSIITCTKNPGSFLTKNTSSVKKQTFKNIEHVFIDGFSKDSTVKKIDQYKKKVSYPVGLYQVKPKGISHAMNLGVKIAKGKYLLHLHADDHLHNPNVLSRAHQFLTQNPKLDWAYGQIQTVEKSGSPIGVFPKIKILKKSLPWLLSYTNFIPHQAVFIKKQVFKKHGAFNENITSKMNDRRHANHTPRLRRDIL